MKTKPKIVAIVGPTASGKSSLAIALAKKFNGEVVSVDSRQVYRGLNLGTGKVTKKEMKGVPHHMLDVADPNKFFSVHEFKIKAEKAIQDILKRGALPILCGGTGLYLAVLLGEMSLPEVPPNKSLRKQLENKSLKQLQALLKKLDSARAKTIDLKNPVRLIRSIEIAKALGHMPAVQKDSKYETLKIGITLPDKVLQKNIHTRLLARIKAGMLKEALKLHANGLSWKKMETLGLEYRYMALYLQKKINKVQMIEQLETAIRQYAKRQKTWFKKDEEIWWVKPTQFTSITKTILNFLQK